MKTCVIFIAIIGATLAATDYCSKDLCDGKHVACGHSGKFHSRCPKGAVTVNIDKKLQQVMLDNFNAKRDFIAGGGDPNYRPACRMATMEWDDELAHLSELNVMQCDFEHDCHNTKKYEYSGQNLYGGWAMGEMEKVDHAAELQSPMKSWYEEITKSNARSVRSLGDEWMTAGHFLTMMHDKNYRVGCGAAMYQKPDLDYLTYMVTCNFAMSSLSESATYLDCDVPAKDCKTGTNPKFPNLCSTAEEYDVTSFNWADKKEE